MICECSVVTMFSNQEQRSWIKIECDRGRTARVSSRSSRGLRRIRIALQNSGKVGKSLPEILQAVDRSIRTINTTGTAKAILRLPHRWQRVVHNTGDYIEGQ
jgi:hypothetical protein